MIIDLLLGALAMWALLFFVDHAKQSELGLHWWQWLLAVLNIIFAIAVVEMALGLLREGSTQAAAIMGLVAGLVVVVWAVLMWRFVFNRASVTARQPDAALNKAD